ncbi:MMPL family transporter [Millisia brevis]|uniref:MMPL family transporter n=1 Tax=Millisia brevis TaxID=264148 RepID=UPI000836BAE8|nr:MMPL family transporter [Millisia brevis]
MQRSAVAPTRHDDGARADLAAGSVRRRLAPVAIVVGVLLAGIWALGLFERLGGGGYYAPDSASARALPYAAAAAGSPDVIAVFTAPEGGSLDAWTAPITATLDEFGATHPDARVMSYWTSPDPIRGRLVSADGRTGLVTVAFPEVPVASIADAERLFADLTPPGLDPGFAGDIALDVAFGSQLQSDLIRAELIAIPLTAILLVIVFGGVVAAAVPVVTGALAVVVALVLLRALTTVVEVSAFAINLAALLGLGLSIDYGLFLVSRFREELRRRRRRSDGRDTVVTAAVRRTMRTAGRTIGFSAILLVAAFLGLLVFPQPVIRSLGLGAICAVIGAAALSLTLVPLLLLALGPRIDALTWSAGAADRADERSARFWTAVVGRVIRRPIPVAAIIALVLLALAAPSAGIRLGGISADALPADSPTRMAFETIQRDFGSSTDTAQIVIIGPDGVPEGPTINSAVLAARATTGVADVRFEQAVTLDRPESGGPEASTEPGTSAAVIAVDYDVGADRERVVRDLRTIEVPEGNRILIGGAAALAIDNNAAIVAALPAMAAIMVGATLALLLVAFGSVLLALKAVLMSALSLGATFGVLTLVFQEGYGAGLLGITPQPLEATFVVVIVAIVFGLSTDYEVFLVSRIVESRGRGADTAEAIVDGARRTGRIITAAALILIVVTGAFAGSGLVSMRMVGVGLIVALIVDATIIRMLLVPALTRLLGPANWWAPPPIAALHRRWGIGHDG